MAVLQAAVAPGVFEMNRVFARAWATFERHGLALVAVFLAIGLPAFAASDGVSEQILQASFVSNAVQNALLRAAATGVASVALVAVEAGLTAWATRILISDQTEGGPVDLWAAARAVAAQAGSLAALSAFLFMGVAAASLLLLVPGLILLLAWVIATPVLAAEHRSPGGSLARSRDLTRGFRGAILALVLAWDIPAVLVRWALAWLVTGHFSGKVVQASAVVQLGLYPLASSLSHLAIALLVASLYVELVTIKEGGLTSRMGEVFA